MADKKTPDGNQQRRESEFAALLMGRASSPFFQREWRCETGFEARTAEEWGQVGFVVQTRTGSRYLVTIEELTEPQHEQEEA